MIAVHVDLESAIATVRDGDFAAAWIAASDETDPLRRAQAELFVRHHAGDLFGALRCGEEALTRFPDDRWLLERVLELALSLRRADAAARASRHLLDLAPRAPADDLPSDASNAAEGVRRALELHSQRDRQRASLTQARAFVASLAFAILSLFALVSRGSN